MSIASRITSIEGHISDIYDSVELTGVDTTDIDKNLVNVPNTLKEGYIDIINNGTDTLYSNFPKVSGEGTSLTLNNTYQAPMRNNLKGNTSQTGTPTPTSPIPVNVVSGDNDVRVCGVNLFDVNEFENQLVTGKILNDNGVEVTDVSSTYSKYLIPVKANETFYRKGAWQRMYVYNSKKQLISRGTGVSGFNSAYTPTEDGYIGFQISNSYWENNKGQEQVNLGNSALSYEPYQGNTYNIDLPSGMELCKIGTYQDYIYKDSDKWYLHKEIGKVVLNGTETGWAVNNSVFYRSFAEKTKGKIGMYSDVFSYKNVAWTSLGNYEMSDDATTTTIFVKDTDYTTIADFKTWLGTNEPSLYFALSTPTTTEITDTTLISQLNALEQATSKNGETNISQVNDDLPFIIYAEAFANTFNGRMEGMDYKIDNCEVLNNKVTSITSGSTDSEYPSAKAVYDLFNSITDGDEVSY